jgi:hypothetical protein
MLVMGITRQRYSPSLQLDSSVQSDSDDSHNEHGKDVLRKQEAGMGKGAGDGRKSSLPGCRA